MTIRQTITRKSHLFKAVYFTFWSFFIIYDKRAKIHQNLG
jgi:hypothetical protein